MAAKRGSREAFWRTVTDDFNGKDFSGSNELAQTLEWLNKIVPIFESLMPMLQEAPDFSIKSRGSVMRSADSKLATVWSKELPSTNYLDFRQ
jgi:hypothetical protein